MLNDIDGVEILERGEKQLISLFKTERPLVGRFLRSGNGDDGYEIVNLDGATILWAIDLEVADFTCRILNLAFNHGMCGGGE